MSRHDLAWRAAGACLFAAAGALGLASDAHGVLCFAGAIAGVVLLVRGARVPLALRIEASRHRELPLAIHERRVARARYSNAERRR